MDCTKRIIEQIAKKGETTNKVLTSCGLSPSALDTWKKGVAKPSLNAIIKLADYFNVSLDYLLNRQSHILELSNIEFTCPYCKDEVLDWLDEKGQSLFCHRCGFSTGVDRSDINNLKIQLKQEPIIPIELRNLWFTLDEVGRAKTIAYMEGLQSITTTKEEVESV